MAGALVGCYSFVGRGSSAWHPEVEDGRLHACKQGQQLSGPFQKLLKVAVRGNIILWQTYFPMHPLLAHTHTHTHSLSLSLSVSFCGGHFC